MEISGCHSSTVLLPSYGDLSLSSVIELGCLPNSWFIGTLACLMPHGTTIKQLFVSTRNVSMGIYTLKFYKDGKVGFIYSL
jgi:hypothetical protein